MDFQARARKTLVITINGGPEHSVPLVQSMAPKDLADMAAARREGGNAFYVWAVRYMERYIGDDMDELTAEDFNDILAAWNNANSPTVGE